MIIVGYHAIHEVLRKHPGKSELLVAKSNRRIEDILHLAKSVGVPVRRVSPQRLDTLSPLEQHRGVVLSVPEMPEGKGDVRSFVRHLVSETALVVILAGVTDPHNLGAILRSADQFAVDLVILPRDRSAQINPTVLKTSAGAASYVRLLAVPNLVQAVKELRKGKFWIYGAEMSGASPHSCSLVGRVGLVFGSEGGGLRRLLGETCDAFVAVPARGHVDSLNVSVAAGILMYETRRQQGLFD